MITMGCIGAISISAALVENRCRSVGNVTGANAARKFGRFFMLGVGGALTWAWVVGAIALIF